MNPTFRTTRTACCSALALFAAVHSPAWGQTCTGHWLNGDDIPGFGGAFGFADSLRCITTWDPDGPGGNGPLMVFAGQFNYCPTIPANNIVTYDPGTGVWAALGDGLNDTVGTVIVAANGDLIAGGSFTMSGTTPVNRVARWNGTAWSSVGSGTWNGTVYALAEMPSGNIIAGGSFLTAGGVTGANRIARFDGASWTAMSVGGANSDVRSLLVETSGDLLVGGAFSTMGGASINRVGRWNSVSGWSSVATGLSGGTVNTIIYNSAGDVVIGGSFNVNLTESGLARLVGGGWQGIGGGVTLGGAGMGVFSLVALPDTGLMVGGLFTAVGSPDIPALGVARWTGAAWEVVGGNGLTTTGVSGNPEIYAMGFAPDGAFFAGGVIDKADGVPALNVAKLVKNDWTSLGVPSDGGINAMTVLPDGDVVAVGYFSYLGGVPVARVARWNGVSWAPMGVGFDSEVNAVVHRPSDGAIFVGGRPLMSGKEFIGRVAVWVPEDNEWFRVGVTTDSTNNVYALAIASNGDLIAGGDFTMLDSTPLRAIARYDGSTWSPLGAGIGTGSSTVAAIGVLENGDIIAAGSFSTPAVGIARWNGSTWSAIGTNTKSGISSLLIMPNGDIIVGGTFSNFGGDPDADNIARWNGSAWVNMGPGGFTGSLVNIKTLALADTGDVIAGGTFSTAGGVPASDIARWNGVTWTAMNTGPDYYIFSAVQHPSGEILAGGNFFHAGEYSAGKFARWTETGGPAILADPQGQAINLGDTLVLSAAVRPGYQGVNIRWQRDGVDIVDGPGGASVGGGTVSGASATLASPTDGSSVTLIITDAQASDAGNYTLVASNACDDARTDAATIVVDGQVCAADFNNDGTVNSTDVSDFINQWFTDQLDGTLVTDWDDNGVVNSTDVSDFINSWFDDTAAGCG